MFYFYWTTEQQGSFQDKGGFMQCKAQSSLLTQVNTGALLK